MPSLRECPRCACLYVAPDHFYVRPGSGRAEYCLVPSTRNDNHARGCHGQYWDRVRERRRAESSDAPTLEPSKRGFGVEIETTLSDVTRVKRAVEETGLRVAYGWIVATDCWSIRGEHCGSELISPILRGEDGRSQVRLACTGLSLARTSVSVQTGLHVHHDARDLSLAEIKRFYRYWHTNQALIEQLVSKSRRGGAYCRPIRPEVVELVLGCRSRKEIARNSHAKYTSVNLKPLVAKGSIEVRLHQGTHDARKILAWVEFGQAMIQRVAGSARTLEVPTHDTLDELLDELVSLGGLSPQTRRYLLRRSATLNPAPTPALA